MYVPHVWANLDRPYKLDAKPKKVLGISVFYEINHLPQWGTPIGGQSQLLPYKAQMRPHAPSTIQPIRCS